MGRVYASSDWHGCGKVGQKILDFLQPDDKLYFIGDAIDRGPDGYTLIKKLLNDPRVTYIRGNHEEFMLNGLKDLIAMDDDPFDFCFNNSLWLDSNGGYKTYEDILKHGLNKKELSDIYLKIKEMPFLINYTSKNGNHILLEHAGYTPDETGEPILFKSHDPLWDRSHFYDAWRGGENIFIVHGHTPVQYLQFEYGYNGQGPKSAEELMIKHHWDSPEINWKPEVIRYCGGHKFDIDMCTIASGRIALLDLDTFETIYFDEEEGD